MNARASFNTPAVCLTVLAAAALLARAGPLNPPAGPVASTLGPEPRIAINATNTPGDAASLFKISQSGSYYLTGNINAVTGKFAVLINADNVTLDLRGFSILGISTSYKGIGAGVVRHVALLNGAVRACGNNGVDLSSVTDTRLADVQASGNQGAGFLVGTNAVVSGCVAEGNAGLGFQSLTNAVYDNCIAVGNTNAGFSLTSYSAAHTCVARGNTLAGFSGSTGCALANCSADANGARGFDLNLASTVTSCSAYSNTGDGVSAGAGSTLCSCSAGSNSANGFSVAQGCTLTGCTATYNKNDGFLIASGCFISSSTALFNGSNSGISGGSGAGIHMANSGSSRIEGNNINANDKGIQVDGAGNVITRNTVGGSTAFNYSLAIGNRVGTIVLMPAIGVAINGSTGGGGLGSTDPWANFSY